MKKCDYAGMVSIERDKKSNDLIITKTESDMSHREFCLSDLQFRELVVMYGEMVGIIQ